MTQQETEDDLLYLKLKLKSIHELLLTMESQLRETQEKVIELWDYSDLE